MLLKCPATVRSPTPSGDKGHLRGSDAMALVPRPSNDTGLSSVSKPGSISGEAGRTPRTGGGLTRLRRTRASWAAQALAPAPQPPRPRRRLKPPGRVCPLNLSVWAKRIKERRRDCSLWAGNSLLPSSADTPRRRASLYFGKKKQNFRYVCSEPSTYMLSKVTCGLGSGRTVS